MFYGPMKLQVNGCNILGDLKKKKKSNLLYFIVMFLYIQVLML